MTYISKVIGFSHDIFRSLIPRPQDRIPLDSYTWPHLLSPLPPIFVMACLARRPDTYYLRLMLLPVTVFCCLRAAFGFMWLEPRFNVYNFGSALFSMAIISRALEFGLTVEGMKKIGEVVVGRDTTPGMVRYRKCKLHDDKTRPAPFFARLLPQSFSDAIELLCSIRGVGFEYGRGAVIPSESRSLERGPFLRATFVLFIRAFLSLDILDTLLKYTPPLRTPHGGSIFIPSLPMVQRYAMSTIIHVGSGCGLLAGFEMVYYLFSIVAIGLFNDLPAAWPPAFNHPWGSHSLQEFWSRRWHQFLRRIFMVFGGIPGKWVGSKIGHGQLGLLFGVFIASGLYHEIPAYALGKGLDWRVPAFFLLHAFLILGERLWRVVTGKKVGGWWGRMWVYFTIIVLGQNLVDSWHTRGLGGGLIIPPTISPMRQLILPTMFRLAKYLH